MNYVELYFGLFWVVFVHCTFTVIWSGHMGVGGDVI